MMVEDDHINEPFASIQTREAYPLKVLVISSRESPLLSLNTLSLDQRDVHYGLMTKCLSLM